MNADVIPGYLETLKIQNIVEWDVLGFLSKHGATLASAEHITRLLGYSRVRIGSALDTLTTNGLVQRSRASNGVRLYRFASSIPSESTRFSLNELINVAKSRKGRLLIIRHLQPVSAEKHHHEQSGLHLA